MTAKRTIRAWAIAAGKGKHVGLMGSSWFADGRELLPPLSCTKLWVTKREAVAALKESSLHRKDDSPLSPHLAKPRVVRVTVTVQEIPLNAGRGTHGQVWFK